MWVVKLGGSLHDTPALRRWLRGAGRRHRDRRASSSRAAGRSPTRSARCSQSSGFDELAAHRMAILAMQQFGLVAAGAGAAAGLAETEAELTAARAAIWLPWRLAGQHARSQPSWDVTSDSLACWLAIRPAATDLLLVKSAPYPTVTTAPPDLPPDEPGRHGLPGFARADPAPSILAHRDAPLGKLLAAPA